MLLRSITKHVKDQNWFAVTLDFFIVVAGILIAFQITNWSEASRERELEREYIARLGDDTARSIMQVSLSNAAMRQQISDTQIVLNSLDTCAIDEADRDNVAKGIFSIGKLDTARFDRTTFAELTSTGRLGLIRDRDIHEKISRILQDIELQQRVELQLVARIAAPLDYIYKRVSLSIPSPELANVDVIKWQYLDADIDVICADPQFRASVSAIRGLTLDLVRWNDRIIHGMKDIQSTINAFSAENGWTVPPKKDRE